MSKFDKLMLKLFGTDDEPTTLKCVLFLGFYFGAIILCITGMLSSLLA